MILNIVWWSNNLVTVFDEKGEQLPELQGMRSDVIERLRACDLSQTHFQAGKWRLFCVDITKEDFFDLPEWNFSDPHLDTPVNNGLGIGPLFRSPHTHDFIPYPGGSTCRICGLNLILRPISGYPLVMTDDIDWPEEIELREK